MMSAFLNIDNCAACGRAVPWEWISSVVVNAKRLAGTGVWRSTLIDGHCPGCYAVRERKRDALRGRAALIALLGGKKPYQEFTFGRYAVTPGNEQAFKACEAFNPTSDNLYLWGPSQVGKTHLAYAAARLCFENRLPVKIHGAVQLIRAVRMNGLAQEQQAIERLVRFDALAVDDLGPGLENAVNRYILQEILDGRDFQCRAGLIVTSRYSLCGLAQKFGDEGVPSRLARMCRIIEIKRSNSLKMDEETEKQAFGASSDCAYTE